MLVSKWWSIAVMCSTHCVDCLVIYTHHVHDQVERLRCAYAFFCANTLQFRWVPDACILARARSWICRRNATFVWFLVTTDVRVIPDKEGLVRARSRAYIRARSRVARDAWLIPARACRILT